MNKKTTPIESSAVEVSGLCKSFGSNEVLRGIDFRVEKGTMLALLGPNGAGKTTTVRILSTLLQPDSGNVLVNGYDVTKKPDEVRKSIGLTGQSAAVDELLTGRENLVMMGRLYRLTKQSSINRANELLHEFDLINAADRPTKTYSGGMRRRLDLAVSLIATPPILFLDEPTTGLDPRSRLVMWDIIKNLMKTGTTILLTTQYLEEADQLADKIILINDGIVAAEGTARELKRKIGRDQFMITLKKTELLQGSDILKQSGLTVSENVELNQLAISIAANGSDVRHVLELLEKNKVTITAMDIQKPSLDDVFLKLTDKSEKQPQETDK